MKKIVFLILVITMFFTGQNIAQEPPHPPTTGHGVTGNQSPGGSAPVGEGVYILLIAAAAYLHIRQSRKREE